MRRSTKKKIGEDFQRDTACEPYKRTDADLGRMENISKKPKIAADPYCFAASLRFLFSVRFRTVLVPGCILFCNTHTRFDRPMAHTHGNARVEYACIIRADCYDVLNSQQWTTRYHGEREFFMCGRCLCVCGHCLCVAGYVRKTDRAAFCMWMCLQLHIVRLWPRVAVCVWSSRCSGGKRSTVWLPFAVNRYWTAFGMLLELRPYQTEEREGEILETKSL